ncbi:hypothetical protein PHEL49_1876 [Polaribacter sp. Hel1_33_49]|nr:hypothetical protein PHEL49_1876 [Polaribacter sp. Hel1_33_49]
MLKEITAYELVVLFIAIIRHYVKYPRISSIQKKPYYLGH